VIAVLGGGVAGSSVALHLALAGAHVTVFDPLLKPNSTERAMGGFRTQHGSALNVALALHSREFFAARADRVRFQPNGYLYLAEDEAVAAELGARAEFQVSLGLPIEHPEPEAVVPFLNGDGYRATNFCALDGLYLPPLVHRVLVEEAEAAGVEFRWGEEAPEGIAESVSAVVIASGNWSTEVGRRLGVELKVTPLERGIFMVGPFDWLRPLPGFRSMGVTGRFWGFLALPLSLLAAAALWRYLHAEPRSRNRTLLLGGALLTQLLFQGESLVSAWWPSRRHWSSWPRWLPAARRSRRRRHRPSTVSPRPRRRRETF